MKRLVIVLAAALAAVAIYAVTAPAGQQTSSSKLSALARRVATLEKKTKVLTARLNCYNQYASISEYGDSSTSSGYVYQNPDKSLAITSALDVTAQGETPDAYFSLINRSCIGSAKLSFSKVAALKPSSH